MADGKKIVIVAPADASSDVDDAVKLLKGAGYDVDIEEPTPKSLLHIVLGLMGPNAYGFGPSYAYAPGSGSGADSDVPPPDDGDDTSSDDDDSSANDADDGDAEAYNFESLNLGTVTVDGELIEAVTIDSETSVLCVQELHTGPKTTYSLNESRFSFFPADVAKPASRVEVLVDKHRTSIEIAVQESKDKSVLKVGKDLRDMFEACTCQDAEHDELMAKKVKGKKAKAKPTKPTKQDDE